MFGIPVNLINSSPFPGYNFGLGENKMRSLSLSLCVIGTLFLASCGGGGSKVNARFIKGGTAARTSSAATGPRTGVDWMLSPDQGKVTFNNITFKTNGGSSEKVTLTNCTVTYDRKAATGASLLDCPMTVAPGTYTQMSICFSATAQVLISDASVPLYTDPSATTFLTATPPVGGAGFVNYTAGATGGDPCFGIPLPNPLVVAASGTATISIITDMTRTIPASLNGGTYSFVSTVGNRPIEIVGVPGSGGSSEYYSDSGSFVRNGPTGEKFTRVYYDSAGSPVAVGGLSVCSNDGPSYAYAFSPTAANALSFDSGIYLGLDSSKVLAWAIPLTSDKAKGSVFTMPRATTLGAPSTINCQSNVTPIPPPTSGDTYSSGAPAIGSTATASYHLWVK